MLLVNPDLVIVRYKKLELLFLRKYNVNWVFLDGILTIKNVKIFGKTEIRFFFILKNSMPYEDKLLHKLRNKVKVGKIYEFFYFYRDIKIWFEGICVSLKRRSFRSINSLMVIRGYVKNTLIELKFLLYSSFFAVKGSYQSLKFDKIKRKAKIYFFSFKFNSWKRKVHTFSKAITKSKELPPGYINVSEIK